ncbi:unnamed protein product [Triticum turgidum subsp. durum]|uniref:Uncharacterized protein n=1 Tax=Triticum turgidum subsp. durum TaxID=4567 RepID=A0A9R0VU36_TRITD|nr:unnamed protein product [Triticum turgidum subsp. durum]
MPMAAPQTRRHQAAFLRSKPPAPAPAPPNGKAGATNGKPAAASSKPNSPASPAQAPPTSSLEDRTVKQLRLAKALTLPEATAVSEACRRMAARRADAALLTDARGVLSGIVTAEVRNSSQGVLSLCNVKTGNINFKLQGNDNAILGAGAG